MWGHVGSGQVTFVLYRSAKVIRTGCSHCSDALCVDRSSVGASAGRLLASLLASAGRLLASAGIRWQAAGIRWQAAGRLLGFRW